MVIFKSKGSEIRDRGTLVDGSKKIELLLNELSDEQVVYLNKLVRDKSVDVILVPSGLLCDMEDIISQILDISESNNSDIFDTDIPIQQA